MNEYICHKCYFSSTNNNNDYYSSEPLQSTYQFDKYFKHTAPIFLNGLNSVFDDTTPEGYSDYIVKAGKEGFVEIDDQGRKNIIYVCHKQTGQTYQNGTPIYADDSVIVVKSSDPNKIHAFPFGSSNAASAVCSRCGNTIR